jgi:dihydrofolate synthase/folylpolyglutamate synthase
LSRIKAVAERLDLLAPKSVVITVGGTNGKGSTVAMLEAIYCEAGYRVGVYTSPHLLVFNERIRLNRKNISDPSLCKAFLTIEQARGSIHLTYFEMATLAALLYFKLSKTDLIILEVGMGGRLDATNIIDSDLAIISTIAFDHQDYLGTTLDAIGYEKAGILRLNKTLIYSDTSIPATITQKADDLNVKTLCLNRDFSYEMSDTQLSILFSTGESLVLPRPGIHPKAAVAGVVASRCLMTLLPVLPQCLERAINIVYIAGRQQVIYGTICTVLDVAHNPQSVNALVERINRLNVTGKIHAVFSGLKDKDLYGLINPMSPYVEHWYSAALDCERGATESMLMGAFQQVAADIDLQFCRSITDAYQMACNHANLGDVIVVYGSFFVVGPIILDNQKEEGWICSG